MGGWASGGKNEWKKKKREGGRRATAQNLINLPLLIMKDLRALTEQLVLVVGSTLVELASQAAGGLGLGLGMAPAVVPTSRNPLVGGFCGRKDLFLLTVPRFLIKDRVFDVPCYCCCC